MQASLSFKRGEKRGPYLDPSLHERDAGDHREPDGGVLQRRARVLLLVAECCWLLDASRKRYVLSAAAGEGSWCLHGSSLRQPPGWQRKQPGRLGQVLPDSPNGMQVQQLCHILLTTSSRRSGRTPAPRAAHDAPPSTPLQNRASPGACRMLPASIAPPSWSPGCAAVTGFMRGCRRTGGLTGTVLGSSGRAAAAAAQTS